MPEEKKEVELTQIVVDGQADPQRCSGSTTTASHECTPVQESADRCVVSSFSEVLPRISAMLFWVWLNAGWPHCMHLHAVLAFSLWSQYIRCMSNVTLDHFLQT